MRVLMVTALIPLLPEATRGEEDRFACSQGDHQGDLAKGFIELHQWHKLKSRFPVP